ncbi:hypothetical protein DP129_05270 [Clostridium tetani]|uniref:TetR family transcriptional regulator n=1 Tax=Clostridium tetani TaxID=1513 RepID=UPI00100BEFC5|nr:TetR family transcriptional regulator [Clostridium tetani]RXI40127.1 hypothetical protein DP129_05270 [Clostridium tetani]
MNSSITKNMIADSFVSLLGQKPYSKITVTAILDECQLSRNVFYYYFHSKEDLVEWICSEITIDLLQNIGSLDLEGMYKEIGSIIKWNKTTYYRIAQIKVPNSLYKQFYRIFYALFDEELKISTIYPTIDSHWSRLLTNFNTHLAASSIIYWIKKDGCKTPLFKYYGQPKYLFINNSPYLPIFYQSNSINSLNDEKSSTQQRIFDALKVISTNKPIYDVTVKEISTHCGITRNGFYYHFKDIHNALLSLYIDQVSMYFHNHAIEDAYTLTQKFFINNTSLFSPNVFNRTQNSIGSFIFDTTLTSVQEKLLNVYAIKEPVATRISTCVSYAALNTLRSDLQKNPIVVSPGIFSVMEKSIPNVLHTIGNH